MESRLRTPRERDGVRCDGVEVEKWRVEKKQRHTHLHLLLHTLTHANLRFAKKKNKKKNLAANNLSTSSLTLTSQMERVLIPLDQSHAPIWPRKQQRFGGREGVEVELGRPLGETISTVPHKEKRTHLVNFLATIQQPSVPSARCLLTILDNKYCLIKVSYTLEPALFDLWFENTQARPGEAISAAASLS